MQMLRRFALISALGAGLALPAFAEPDADTVIATVGGTEITLGQMIVMAGQLPEEYQALPDDILYQAVLDQLISQTALAQTVEGTLDRATAIALENERVSFLAGEALNRAVDAAVTDEAVAAAYTEQFEAMEPVKEYNAAHILVETEEEAAAIKAELEAGADFEALAREKSIGPSGASGGALGWFGTGMMVKPFEDAVVALDKGAYSDPVQTQFGWHIVWLKDIRDKAAPALDTVRAQIAQVLQEKAINDILEEVKAKTAITTTETEIDPALLRKRALLVD